MSRKRQTVVCGRFRQLPFPGGLIPVTNHNWNIGMNSRPSGRQDVTLRDSTIVLLGAALRGGGALLEPPLGCAHPGPLVAQRPKVS